MVEPREGTHDHRVLTLLRDGKPHTHLEIYDLRVVCHSRIAGLRKKGFGIRAWRDGDLYMYQLVLDGAGGAHGTDGLEAVGVPERPGMGDTDIDTAAPAPSSTTAPTVVSWSCRDPRWFPFTTNADSQLSFITTEG